MSEHQLSPETQQEESVNFQGGEQPQTVEISQEEYQFLQQIVIDAGRMISLMQEIQGVFTGFTNGQELTLASIGKMILSRPGKFKTAAESLAPAVIKMAPYIKKYGPHAQKMTQVNEHTEQNTPDVPVSGSQPES